MTQNRSVIIPDQEISQYCSIFDYVDLPTILFDSQLRILYRNAGFENYIHSENVNAEDLNQVVPGLESALISFFERNHLSEVWEHAGWRISIRRVVTNKTEYAATTFVHKSTESSTSEKDDLNFEYKSWFRSLVDNALEAILIMDFERRVYVEANPRAVKMFGYSRNELLGRHVGDLSPNSLEDGREARSVSVSNIQKCVDTGESVEFDWTIKKPDGTLVPCVVRVVRLPTNEGIFVRSSITDVSSQRKTKEDLEKSEKRFRSLFKNSTVGIVLIDTEKREVMDVNPFAQTILGLSKDQLMKNPFVFFDRQGGKAKSKSHGQFQDFVREVLVKNAAPLKLSFTRPDESQVHLRGEGYKLNKEEEGVIVIGFSDVSNAVLRKRQYLKQTNQLNAFVKNNIIPVAMFDRDMNYLLVSEKWLNIYPTEFGEKIIGKNYYELHPKIPQRWKLIHMKAMRGRTISNEQDLHIRANGEEVWFRWLAKPWYEDDENIGGIIIFSEVITEEVVSKEKAKKQEARYKSFFENSTLGWIEAEADELLDYCMESKVESFSHERAFELFQMCKVVNINQQVRDVFGYKTGSVEDFRPMSYVRGNMVSFAQKLINNIRKGVVTFEYELNIKNSRGDTRNLFVSVRLPQEEDYRYIVYGVLDVTDLKSSISALRESEERYRTMFESNSLGVVYTNYKKKLIRVNAAFEEMFGYTEQEMQNISESVLLYPKYKKIQEAWLEGLKSGKNRFVSADKEYKRKNGKKLIAHTSASALYDEEGEHYGTVTIIDDITERKLTERRMEKQNAELKKINQELDQFVYSAAHDLRAPIANVLGLVKLLKMEDISGEAHHYVQLQEKSLDKLDEFIKSIVDYSRNSRLALSKDEIELKSFVQDVVDQYLFSENANLLNISIKSDQKSSFVSDKNRLSIVLNNLVSNAVRYMDPKKKSPFINIQIHVNRNSATIEVEDNGLGIEQKHLKSIFDLFYRANADSKGTGIGLYIVKETIEKLKGTISVASKIGMGTKFKVQIKNFSPTKRKKR